MPRLSNLINIERSLKKTLFIKFYLLVYCVIRDYYMTFSISALVPVRDSHIKPDSEAGGLLWVDGYDYS